MITVPLLIRDECPLLEDNSGDVVNVIAETDSVGLALQTIDSLRQGFAGGSVEIDKGGFEIRIVPTAGLCPVAFDLPGRQTATHKRRFASLLIAGRINGYVQIQPAIDQDAYPVVIADDEGDDQ